MSKYIWRVSRIVGSALLFTGLLWPMIAGGQEGIPDPFEKYRIYDNGYNLFNIRWANDSTSLVFQEGDGQTGVLAHGAYNWHQYVVGTQQNLKSDTWPLQPSLTPAQEQTFELRTVTSPYMAKSFAFSSPDNRYIVYLAQQPDYAIGVADLRSEQHQILDEADELLAAALITFNGAYNTTLEVFWSESNNAFAIITLLPPLATRIHFVNDLGDLSNPPNIRNLTYEGMTIESSWYYALDLFDLSSDGNSLLVADGMNRFVLWDMSTTSGTLIPSQGHIAGATFLDGDHILFIDETGLQELHLSSSGIKLVNSEITSTWAAGGAYFSPDGRYVAIYNGGEGGPARLYLFEIAALN